MKRNLVFSWTYTFLSLNFYQRIVDKVCRGKYPQFIWASSFSIILKTTLYVRLHSADQVWWLTVESDNDMNEKLVV